MTKDFYYYFFIPFYFEGKLQTDILKKYLIKKKLWAIECSLWVLKRPKMFRKIACILNMKMSLSRTQFKRLIVRLK